jgi:hypothetical protein
MLFLSCEKDSPIAWSNLEVDLDEVGECKQFDFKDQLQAPLNDCLSYEFRDSVLVINRINAGFNCCPNEVIVSSEFSNDTLFITETEVDAFCDCNCLYDISYTITPVQKTAFVIHVNEALGLRSDESALSFSVDLIDVNSGEFCVERTGYPWLNK